MHDEFVSSTLTDQHLSALTTTFREQRRALVRKAQLITRCRANAEDVVQEAFLRALNELRHARGLSEAHLRYWLLTVVRRAAIDRKRRARNQAILTPLADALRAPLREPLAIWTALEPAHIWAVAKELAWTPAMRTTFEMRFKNRLSYQQIAVHLGVPIQTVGSRLNRATRLLRSAIVTGMAQPNANGVSAVALSSFEQELNG